MFSKLIIELSGQGGEGGGKDAGGSSALSMTQTKTWKGPHRQIYKSRSVCSGLGLEKGGEVEVTAGKHGG